MTAQHLANKFRRAKRNDTGTHFTADELELLWQWGVMEIVLRQELEELQCGVRKSGSIQSDLSGLPAASNRHSSRSVGTTERSLGIKALVAGR